MVFPARRQATGSGFTLIELVLTVALLLLLMGAAVFNFKSLQRGSQLEEGAGQLEFLLRYARAQAASTGRQIKVSFGGESSAAGPQAVGAASPASTTAAVAGTNNPSSMPVGWGPEGIQVTWEPDSLGAPGVFVLLSDATPFTDRINDLVRIQTVSDLGSGSTNAPNPAVDAMVMDSNQNGISGAGSSSPGTGSSSPFPRAVVFYPDGSSDSGEWIVVSTDPEDTRRLRMRLSGLTGAVHRAWLSPEGQPPEPEEPKLPEEDQGNSGSTAAETSKSQSPQ